MISIAESGGFCKSGGRIRENKKIFKKVKKHLILLIGCGIIIRLIEFIGGQCKGG